MGLPALQTGCHAQLVLSEKLDMLLCGLQRHANKVDRLSMCQALLFKAIERRMT